MRSETMRRFHVEQPARNYGNDPAREQIASQVDEFLAKGGEIQEVESHIGTQPTFGFNLGQVDKANYSLFKDGVGN